MPLPCLGDIQGGCACVCVCVCCRKATQTKHRTRQRKLHQHLILRSPQIIIDIAMAIRSSSSSSPFLLGFLLVAHLLFSAPFFSLVSASGHQGFANGEVPEDSDIDVADFTEILAAAKETEPQGEETVFAPGAGKGAPGVQTVHFFPDKSVVAGDEAEILVEVSNQGDFPLKARSIAGILLAVHDQTYYGIENLPVMEITDSTVPPSVHASFAYRFTVSKTLQPGSYILIASISYEVDGQQYESVFYNGDLEVVKRGMDLIMGETMALVMFGLGSLCMLGKWIHGKWLQRSKYVMQRIRLAAKNASKKGIQKRGKEIVGEWLQGTSVTQMSSRSTSQQRKSKKQK